MKWLFIFMLVVNTTGWAQDSGYREEGGTGAGNGDGASERDQYLKSVKNTLGQEDEAVADFSSMSSWAGRAVSVLQMGKSRALRKLIQEDRPQEAYDALLSTLTAVANSLRTRTADSGPMTRKLVYRTLRYTQILDQRLTPSQSPIAPVTTKLNLLFQSYNFIIDIAQNLDRQFYIPFHYRYGGAFPGCGTCSTPQFDYGEYQNQFLRFAAKQIDFLNKTMTTNSIGNYAIYTVVPKGSHEGYLSVAELLTKYVWQDLRQNLYAYGNLDAIDGLFQLNKDLKNFNATPGDRTVFSNREEAVHATSETLEMIRCSIRTYCNQYYCGHSTNTCQRGKKCTLGSDAKGDIEFTFNISVY